METPSQTPDDRPAAIDTGPLPHISEFVTTIEQVDQRQYEGRCAEIFFGNTGPGIFKWMHYLPIYQRIFGPFVGRPLRFLEIGVLAGYGGTAGQVRIGSQADPDFLRAVVTEMGGVDIVLDDGSHVASHQRASYEVLFPLLEDGGLYVIEDLHTSYWPDYEGGLKRAGTGIEFLKDLIDQMHRHYFTRGANLAEAMLPVQSIQFFDSIAVLEKRAQHPRRLAIAPNPDAASADGAPDGAPA